MHSRINTIKEHTAAEIDASKNGLRDDNHQLYQSFNDTAQKHGHDTVDFTAQALFGTEILDIAKNIVKLDKDWQKHKKNAASHAMKHLESTKTIMTHFQGRPKRSVHYTTDSGPQPHKHQKR